MQAIRGGCLHVSLMLNQGWAVVSPMGWFWRVFRPMKTGLFRGHLARGAFIPVKTPGPVGFWILVE